MHPKEEHHHIHNQVQNLEYVLYHGVTNGRDGVFHIIISNLLAGGTCEIAIKRK
jgi:hypothetical protein